MSGFIEGQERSQSVLFPEQLEDWITEDNPVRAVDAFVEALDLAGLGFERARAADTGRPVSICSAALSRARIRSMSGFGVCAPRVDIFLKQ